MLYEVITVTAEHHHQQDHEEHEGQRVDDVHSAHHDAIGHAAVIAGHRAVGDADGQAYQRGDQADSYNFV